MNLAKVTSTRQITVPIEICKKINIKPGDKVLFTENEHGEILFRNASTTALEKAQAALDGVADRIGVKDDDDIMQLVREVRYEQGDE